MPLLLIRQDITKMKTDAVVSAVRPDFSGTGGAEAALLAAGGLRLRRAVKKIGHCPVGKVRLTKGYGLSAKYVIHTAGPTWHQGDTDEKEALAMCYRNALTLALSVNCRSIAFPLIATGAGGFPGECAIETAVSTIRTFLQQHDMDVFLVFYDGENVQIGTALYGDIARFIDEREMPAHTLHFRNTFTAAPPMESVPDDAAIDGIALQSPMQSPKARKNRLTAAAAAPARAASPEDMTRELTEILRQTDESFSQLLLRKIDESGMTDAQCYKKANIDRKLFSKIRSDVHYRPSKMTVLAFAVALEMDLEETEALLRCAGFALSPSSKSDLILEYFIERGIYDVFLINEALFAFDQRLLGG
ncbi:MAG: macro domain-containing protein [Oscillospiraceae bacterium]|nr:macro domain-containing protein [Oscillospiraceae bacterium]